MFVYKIFAFRSDSTKDNKLGTLSSSLCRLVELAAVVFYRVVIICSVFFTAFSLAIDAV